MYIGYTLDMITTIKRKCLVCESYFFVPPSRLKHSPAKFCSRTCQGKMLSKRQVGNNNPMWRGDKVGIDGIHEWLKNNFGKADRCENPKCEKKSHYYEWSKLENKSYARRRYNFWRLCLICHKKYDKLYKNIPSNFGKKYPLKHRKNISNSLKGRKLSEETKKKISIAHIGKTSWNKKIC